jgi:hypothetical protein
MRSLVRYMIHAPYTPFAVFLLYPSKLTRFFGHFLSSGGYRRVPWVVPTSTEYFTRYPLTGYEYMYPV